MIATVIGGGIAGLTIANLLSQRGISFQVFEATDEFRPIGAGIILSPNALYILDQIGLLEKIQLAGHPLPRFDIANCQGIVLQQNNTDGTIYGKSYEGIGIHRAKFLQILQENLNLDSVQFGKKLSDIDTHHKQIRFADNTSVSYEYLLACDGFHSKARSSITKNASFRYSGQSCWRGVVHKSAPPFPAELWGCGKRFGYVPIANDQTYWYATITQKKNLAIDDIDFLANEFNTFAPFVSDLIRQTKDSDFIQHDISELNQLKSWHNNNVALIGDAAHAMTPNLGQGAAQSIEDAWVLANSIVEQSSLENAFKQYQQLRYQKATSIAKQSWMIGQITNWKSSMACAIRNKLIAKAPQYLVNRQKNQLFTIPSFRLS